MSETKMVAGVVASLEEELRWRVRFVFSKTTTESTKTKKQQRKRKEENEMVEVVHSVGPRGTPKRRQMADACRPSGALPPPVPSVAQLFTEFHQELLGFSIDWTKFYRV